MARLTQRRCRSPDPVRGTLAGGLVVGAIALTGAPAMAQQGAIADPAAAYNDCMALARRSPAEGFEKALDLRTAGLGAPADHCAAIALYHQGSFTEAATRLEDLAGRTRSVLRIDLLAQAGQAWLRGGKPARAEAALTAAIKLSPNDAELYLDRSHARAAASAWGEALEDLDHAVKLAPRHALAHAYRATAHRYLNKIEPARADAEKAVILAPDLPEALLERGILNRLSGRPEAARADWLAVIKAAPDHPAARAARANLEKLDLSGK